ncbi:MAG: hemerythrin domain-containing protein [Caldimonas sp.]
MADSKSKGRAADRKRLNMSQPYEVAYAKSDRASPERKALLAKAEAAKKSSAKKGAAKKSTAKKSAPRAATSKSASPAMKRTNAAPSRTKAPTPTKRATPKPPKAEKTAENTAPKTMNQADAVDLLTDDHLEVGALFKKYERLAGKEAPTSERKTLSQTICDMLKAHTTIEEEIFYPAARKAGIDADLLDEADIEHASAKELIAQIEGGNPDDDHYDAKVKVLGEYITHHVVEEHTEMFTKCRRSSMDLVGLRGEMEARKMALVPDRDAKANGGKDEGKSTGLLASLFAK